MVKLDSDNLNKYKDYCMVRIVQYISIMIYEQKWGTCGGMETAVHDPMLVLNQFPPLPNVGQSLLSPYSTHIPASFSVYFQTYTMHTVSPQLH